MFEFYHFQQDIDISNTKETLLHFQQESQVVQKADSHSEKSFSLYYQCVLNNQHKNLVHGEYFFRESEIFPEKIDYPVFYTFLD